VPAQGPKSRGFDEETFWVICGGVREIVWKGSGAGEIRLPATALGFDSCRGRRLSGCLQASYLRDYRTLFDSGASQITGAKRAAEVIGKWLVFGRLRRWEQPGLKNKCGFFRKKKHFPLTKLAAVIKFLCDFGLMNINVNPQSGGPN
jgi:hypothetical protein